MYDVRMWATCIYPIPSYSYRMLLRAASDSYIISILPLLIIRRDTFTDAHRTEPTNQPINPNAHRLRHICLNLHRQNHTHTRTPRAHTLWMKRIHFQSQCEQQQDEAKKNDENVINNFWIGKANTQIPTQNTHDGNFTSIKCTHTHSLHINFDTLLDYYYWWNESILVAACTMRMYTNNNPTKKQFNQILIR